MNIKKLKQYIALIVFFLFIIIGSYLTVSKMETVAFALSVVLAGMAFGISKLSELLT